jgi:hypothetical protein
MAASGEFLMTVDSRFDGRAAGRAGRTGLRWDLLRSGFYKVTARSAGGALHPCLG